MVRHVTTSDHELGKLYRPSELYAQVRQVWPSAEFRLGGHKGTSSITLHGIRGRSVWIAIDRTSDFALWRAADSRESCVGALLRRRHHRHIWDQILALAAWLRGEHERIPLVSAPA